ncbi:unnamed protein product [Commensalibacter papalotli (ex Botero et al. 2024)]|nr:unnamed protein product [Commensalibacter papalotli (ex Botero et al. 2024)]
MLSVRLVDNIDPGLTKKQRKDIKSTQQGNTFDNIRFIILFFIIIYKLKISIFNIYIYRFFDQNRVYYY